MMSKLRDQHTCAFTARLNVIYHESRQRRFSSILSWTAFLSLSLSSAAFASLGDLLPAPLAGRALAAILASVVTALNGFVLAFGVVEGFKNHAALRTAWMAVLVKADLLREGDPNGLEDIAAEIGRLSAEEPPANKRALDKAYLETCKALGLSPSDANSDANAAGSSA